MRATTPTRQPGRVMPEAFRSHRWFRQLSAPELLGAVGFERQGVNAGRANREMRRRAALAELEVNDWIRLVQ
jgi:hypothetical protein